MRKTIPLNTRNPLPLFNSRTAHNDLRLKLLSRGGFLYCLLHCRHNNEILEKSYWRVVCLASGDCTAEGGRWGDLLVVDMLGTLEDLGDGLVHALHTHHFGDLFVVDLLGLEDGVGHH